MNYSASSPNSESQLELRWAPTRGQQRPKLADRAGRQADPTRHVDYRIELIKLGQWGMQPSPILAV